MLTYNNNEKDTIIVFKDERNQCKVCLSCLPSSTCPGGECIPTYKRADPRPSHLHKARNSSGVSRSKAAGVRHDHTQTLALQMIHLNENVGYPWKRADTCATWTREKQVSRQPLWSPVLPLWPPHLTWIRQNKWAPGKAGTVEWLIFDYKTCANPEPNAEGYLNNGVILIPLYAK